MQFEYIKRECDFGIVYTPHVSVSLNGFPIGHALIDTGADVTLLPMELNTLLQLDLDTDHAIDIGSAGGGRFKAIPTTNKITYTIEHSGFRPITWKGTAYFAPRQPTVLLGQHECLAGLNITLDGPHRKIYVKAK